MTRIWDNFTRIYHFSQLILIGLLWYTGDNGMFELHFASAFVLLALLVTRILWGIFGSTTSKFSHFVKSPFHVLKAWKENLIAKPAVGHNPVAGYMIIALMLSMLVQLFTGLFSSDDVFSEGPLYVFVDESFASSMVSLHHSNFDILLALISLHVLAGILHLIRGDNVIKAIFTGFKNNIHEKPNSLVFKSAVLPIIIWLIISVVIYQWGMAYASY
ncbi:cytochrome b/b6 domain-containing protein [Thalassotalea crassostreae]|uniref:cytochrome b/b6 domain-containing protein n=1 Tax=Thalassotalea crassostreae TaxID=1763536 RepID=UPI0008395C7E|nr:cytochrome b/b6 domain-containing protein [Thalassotalea crassostreae]